jgi:hypothetical protein
VKDERQLADRASATSGDGAATEGDSERLSTDATYGSTNLHGRRLLRGA